MARSEAIVSATPEEVFAVLADARGYGEWVVGSQAIRGVEGPFPEPGSRFRHRVGWGPLVWPDETEVVAADPPHRLVLQARTRPFATARVTIMLRPVDRGTRVIMIEDPGDPLTRLWFSPLTHLLVRVRNAESLRRLKALVERTAA